MFAKIKELKSKRKLLKSHITSKKMCMILYVQFFKFLEAIQLKNKQKKIQRFYRKVHSKHKIN
jgi:hypothetical protein